MTVEEIEIYDILSQFKDHNSSFLAGFYVGQIWIRLKCAEDSVEELKIPILTENRNVVKIVASSLNWSFKIDQSCDGWDEIILKKINKKEECKCKKRDNPHGLHIVKR